MTQSIHENGAAGGPCCESFDRLPHYTHLLSLLLAPLLIVTLAGCELNKDDGGDLGDDESGYTDTDSVITDPIQDAPAIQRLDKSGSPDAGSPSSNDASNTAEDERYAIDKILEEATTLMEKNRLTESLAMHEEAYRRMIALDPESEWVERIRGQIEGIRYMQAKPNKPEAQ